MSNADWETGVPVAKKKPTRVWVSLGPAWLELPFDDPDGNVLPYSKPLDSHHTSRDAALRLAPKAGSIRRIILDELIAHGPGTRQELTERTGLGYQTVTGGSGVWWLCRNGWAVIDGTRGGEGIVRWSGQRPDIIG